MSREEVIVDSFDLVHIIWLFREVGEMYSRPFFVVVRDECSPHQSEWIYPHSRQSLIKAHFTLLERACTRSNTLSINPFVRQSLPINELPRTKIKECTLVLQGVAFSGAPA